MIRSGILMVAGILCTGNAAAQTNANSQEPSKAPAVASPQVISPLPAGSVVRAKITSSIDSKKLKPGDAVSAQTVGPIKEDGNTIIPGGSKLIGHVTQSAARSKGNAFSTLGIAFDKAVPKSGQEIPLNVSIQALASPSRDTSIASSGPEMQASPMGNSGTMPNSGARPGMPNTMTPPAGSASGNVTNTVANTDTNNAASGKGAVGGLDASGQLTSESRGVFGLQGIGLAAGTIGADPGTVITSTGKEVRLDSGTQLLLVTQPQSPSQASR
jgi:hypothetical protein